MMERIISYGLEKALDGLTMCDEFIECIKKCARNGEEKEVCINNCNIDIVNEHGLSFDTEIIDECSLILNINFEKIIDKIWKETTEGRP